MGPEEEKKELEGAAPDAMTKQQRVRKKFSAPESCAAARLKEMAGEETIEAAERGKVY